jgi:hypothetical protein
MDEAKRRLDRLKETDGYKERRQAESRAQPIETQQQDHDKNDKNDLGARQQQLCRKPLTHLSSLWAAWCSQISHPDSNHALSPSVP